jgi:caffeoyl-CoA O-methyltransferase
MGSDACERLATTPPMKEKSLPPTPELCDYVRRHASRAGDPALAALRAETEAFGEISRMLISEEQGNFLTLLVAAAGVRAAIEVGTFTGSSSICIARGLAAGGRLLCVDQSDEWTSIARRYWKAAGVADRIELRLGDGSDILRKLGDARFDFAFIDADKPGYDTYYELLLPRMEQNALIVFDNMLYGGAVAEPDAANPNARILDALNEKLARDPRVESVLLLVADGLNICRKK